MQTMGDTVQVVGAVAILVILVLVAHRLWRLLSLRIDQKELTYIRQFIATLVAAAEQKANAGVLEKGHRLEWVLEELLARFPHLGHAQADVLIHSEVYDLNLSEKAAGSAEKPKE